MVDEIAIILHPPSFICLSIRDSTCAAAPVSESASLHVSPEALESAISDRALSTALPDPRLLIQVLQKCTNLVRADVTPFCPEAVIYPGDLGGLVCPVSWDPQ